MTEANRTPPEPSDEQINHAHEKAEELEGLARRLGLYVEGFQLGVTEVEDGSLKMLIIAEFLPGDVAWSNRVQDPETDQMDVEFRAIQSDLEADEFENYRRQLAERLEASDDEEG